MFLTESHGSDGGLDRDGIDLAEQGVHQGQQLALPGSGGGIITLCKPAG